MLIVVRPLLSMTFIETTLNNYIIMGIVKKVNFFYHTSVEVKTNTRIFYSETCSNSILFKDTLYFTDEGFSIISI